MVAAIMAARITRRDLDIPPFEIRPFSTATGYHLTLIVDETSVLGLFLSVESDFVEALSLFIQLTRVFCSEKDISSLMKTRGLKQEFSLNRD